LIDTKTRYTAFSYVRLSAYCCGIPTKKPPERKRENPKDIEGNGDITRFTEGGHIQCVSPRLAFE